MEHFCLAALVGASLPNAARGGRELAFLPPFLAKGSLSIDCLEGMNGTCLFTRGSTTFLKHLKTLKLLGDIGVLHMDVARHGTRLNAVGGSLPEGGPFLRLSVIVRRRLVAGVVVVAGVGAGMPGAVGNRWAMRRRRSSRRSLAFQLPLKVSWTGPGRQSQGRLYLHCEPGVSINSGAFVTQCMVGPGKPFPHFAAEEVVWEPYFQDFHLDSDCAGRAFTFGANCFSIAAAAAAGSCKGAEQRPQAVCEAFCGIVNSTKLACGGLGVCYPEGSYLVPTCLCQDGFVQDGGIYCIAEGCQRAGVVISAVNAAGTDGEGGGVGYAGMDARSVAVEFDTFTDAAHGDLPGHHVGLNTDGTATSIKAVRAPFHLNGRIAYTAWIDYKPGSPGTLSVYLTRDDVKPDVPLLESPLSLCDVLQPTPANPSFYFGTVSIVPGTIRLHIILNMS
ncbi:unnamed protein product [Closterium sp. NIES-54]